MTYQEDVFCDVCGEFEPTIGIPKVAGWVPSEEDDMPDYSICYECLNKALQLFLGKRKKFIMEKSDVDEIKKERDYERDKTTRNKR